MRTHADEKKLYELFQRQVKIPASAQNRLDHIYEEVQHSCWKKEDNILHIHNRHHGRTVIAIGAVVIVLVGSALAIGLTHTNFIKSAFGNGIESREVETIPKLGGLPEIYPANERVDVDPECAEAIIGNYIADIGTAVEIEGFTLTIESYVMDTNGIACLTCTVENPNGLDSENLCNPTGGFWFWFNFYTSSNDLMDSREFIDSSLSTDTKATIVTYITPFGSVAKDDGMEMTISLNYESDDISSTETTITIPASEKVAGVEFANGDIIASLSPVGIAMKYTSYDPSDSLNEPTIHDLRIKYADGIEYIVKCDEQLICNLTVSSIEEQTIYTAFNRLVDVDNVTSIIVDGVELISA